MYLKIPCQSAITFDLTAFMWLCSVVNVTLYVHDSLHIKGVILNHIGEDDTTALRVHEER